MRVDFGFRRRLAAKIEGHLVGACYQCGACVGDCPAATYGSGFNPREIMLKALVGLGEELIGEGSVLWQCTNCGNCQERCPQEVRPLEVILALKNMMADRGTVPEPVAKVVRAFEATGRTTPVGPIVERERQTYGLAPLGAVPVAEIQALLGPNDPSEAPLSVTRQPAERLGEERRFAFFPGCLIPTRYPAMEFAIRSALPSLGLELVDLEGASCCPDPIYFKSKDKLAWLTIAARNLSLAEEQGLDIVTNCSGCTATLSEAAGLLEDAGLRDPVNARLARIGRRYEGTSRVRHVATLLRDVAGQEAIRRSVVRPLDGLKVAIHYGCHLLKPSRTMRVDDPDDPHILEDLVTALGATPVRHRNWQLCCGKACQPEDLPARMMHDLLSTVARTGADLLCLVCPTCFGQFDHGQLKVARQFDADYHTPPVYYLQLLAFAQGVAYERLGFERQRLKPEVLRRFDA